nr:glutamate-cysteine ligase family protein [Actinomycetota bacterium]
GLHPTAELGDARLVDAERYRRVDEEMRGLIRRTPECALHVHVGMPDAETALRAFNGLRARLPLLQGLSANSPRWFGVDSGLASARFALVRAYPGRGIPPAFRDFGDWIELVGQAAAAGGLGDYTLLWWDVRLHPRLGTVEVREMDAQASREDAAALAALVHALAVHEAQRAPVPPPPPPEAIAWSSFRAARDGLEATILHEGTLAPLELAARETVARVRSQARELGADGALEGIERILRRGGGAARQRAAYADGGTAAVLDMLVEETAR